MMMLIKTFCNFKAILLLHLPATNCTLCSSVIPVDFCTGSKFFLFLCTSISCTKAAPIHCHIINVKSGAFKINFQNDKLSSVFGKQWWKAHVLCSFSPVLMLPHKIHFTTLLLKHLPWHWQIGMHLDCTLPKTACFIALILFHNACEKWLKTFCSPLLTESHFEFQHAQKCNQNLCLMNKWSHFLNSEFASFVSLIVKMTLFKIPIDQKIHSRRQSASIWVKWNAIMEGFQMGP